MIEDTIRTLEAEQREAQLTSDVATLDRLINDELLFTGPDVRSLPNVSAVAGENG